MSHPLSPHTESTLQGAMWVWEALAPARTCGSEDAGEGTLGTGLFLTRSFARGLCGDADGGQERGSVRGAAFPPLSSGGL